jgi:hypothetical protein
VLMMCTDGMWDHVEDAAMEQLLRASRSGEEWLMAMEAELLKKWERKYKVPMFTSGTNHVRALNAFKVKRFVGATYFTGPINDLFSKYFVEAGFDVLGMEGISVPFDRIGQLSSHEVYAHVKRAFLKHRKGAQAIYLLGSGWRVLPVIDMLEQDLGVPVIHPVPARCAVSDLLRSKPRRQPDGRLPASAGASADRRRAFCAGCRSQACRDRVRGGDRRRRAGGQYARGPAGDAWPGGGHASPPARAGGDAR